MTIKFIDKLIEETQQGILDYVWEYYGNDRFKYVADKHPLKDLNFSLSDIVTKEKVKDSGKVEIVLDKTKGMIVFPNGAELDVDKQSLELLSQECHNAILRAMESTAYRYANGIIQSEIEATKKKAEADKKNKDKKNKEKPTDEKQENQLKV